MNNKTEKLKTYFSICEDNSFKESMYKIIYKDKYRENLIPENTPKDKEPIGIWQGKYFYE